MHQFDKTLREAQQFAAQNGCSITINVVPRSSTTNANFTVVVPWATATATLDPKEVKRFTRAAAWAERANARAQAWFEEEIKRIEADAAANAWRPRVSNRPVANDQQLYFHSLGRASSDETYPSGGPTWKTYRNRYNRGWCGLTLSNISPFEQVIIDTFIKTVKKRDLLITVSDEFTDYHQEVGQIVKVSRGFWFRKLDEHNRFVEVLNAIPPRSNMILLKKDKLPRQVTKWLAGSNWCLDKGTNGAFLTMAESNNAVLVKLFYED